MPNELWDLHVDEISAVGAGANRGARVVLMKMDEKGEEIMASKMSEVIAKSLTPHDGDTEREAMEKAVATRQLQEGRVSEESFLAQRALEAIAKVAHQEDPGKSFEVCYVEALDQNPEFARLLN